MTDWSKFYKRQKDLIVQPTYNNFNGTDEVAICSQFGCGRKLTSIESLAGSKCVHCMGKSKTLDYGRR